MGIQNAFKIVPIHWSYWELLGFTIDNGFFFDKTIPIRLILVFFCQWIFALGMRKQIERVVHLQDDILGIAKKIWKWPQQNKVFVQGYWYFDQGVKKRTSLHFANVLGIALDSVLMGKR